MNYSSSAKRLLTCQRGGAERRCAELEMRSIADPENTKRIIQSFLANLVGDVLPEAQVFQTLGIENVMRLITEPDGLVPHAYVITRTMKGTGLVEGREQRFEQVDRREVSFTYP